MGEIKKEHTSINSDKDPTERRLELCLLLCTCVAALRKLVRMMITNKHKMHRSTTYGVLCVAPSWVVPYERQKTTRHMRGCGGGVKKKKIGRSAKVHQIVKETNNSEEDEVTVPQGEKETTARVQGEECTCHRASARCA